MRRSWSLVAIAVTSLLAACGPAPEENRDHAPVISNYVYQPSTIASGQSFTIFCSVDYQDPDGDITLSDFAVRFPDGSLFEGEAIELEGEYGVTAGTVDFRIYANVSALGDYLVEIWLVDERGHTSNRLPATITVH